MRRSLVTAVTAVAAIGVLLAAPGPAYASSAPTVFGVSPAVGRTTGGAEVTVVGSNLGTVTKVTFGGKPGTHIVHVTSTMLRVTSPPDRYHGVTVQVTNPSGTSEDGNAGGQYYYVPHSPHFAWSKPATVSGTGANAAGLFDVSCVASDHCVTISADGHAYTWNGHVMSRRTFDPNAANRYFNVSCASTTFCAAAGTNYTYLGGERDYNDSHFAVLKGSTWGASTVVGTRGGQVQGLSCHTSFCVAVQDHQAYVYRGSTWAKSSLPAGVALSGVSCPYHSFCLGIGSKGGQNVETVFDGTTWGAANPIYDPHGLSGADVLSTVACSMPTYCVAAGNGVPYIRRGSTWGRGQLGSSSDNGAGAITCPEATMCMEVSAHTMAFDGAAASDTPQPLYQPGLSCPTDALCMSVSHQQISVAHRVAPSDY